MAADERDVPGTERDRIAPARAGQPGAALEDDLDADCPRGRESQPPRGVEQRAGDLGPTGAHRRHGVADQI
jgi:hypothetical protein